MTNNKLERVYEGYIPNDAWGCDINSGVCPVFCFGVRLGQVLLRVVLMTNLTGRGVYQKTSQEVKKLDKEYFAWLRSLPCLIGINCRGVTEACHVRLWGRAGTGAKPYLSGVPMCSLHHGQQHQFGHEIFGDKDWWINHADAFLRRFSQLVR